MKFLKNLFDISYEEKISILATLSFVLIAVVVVLYSFLASRGQDVEYFKHRLGLMEQRLNNMDQKIDKVAQDQHTQKEHLNEIRRMTEAQQRQLEDQQRWVEHWKNLPQLPKPPNNIRR
jgi:cell shape-determining protein MreC